ncbi:MAG: ABC transporter substrate-binding protein [bacterium]|nr:ABC transporter substrate-binding protein [bacterium]
MTSHYIPKKRGFPILVIICFITVLFSACDMFEVDKAEKTYTNPIKFALLSPLGDGTAWAESINYAVVMAAEEINSAGGITIGSTDYQVQVVIMNTAGSAATGLEEIQKFYNDGGRIVIGPSYSSTTLGTNATYDANNIDGVADFAIKNNVIIMSYSATSAYISTLNTSAGDLDTNKMVWRTCPSDKMQAYVGAKYLSDNFASRDVYGSLYRNDLWGSGLDYWFNHYFTDGSLGGSLYASKQIAYDSELGSSDDYNSILDTLFLPSDTNIELVYLSVFDYQATKISNDIVSGNHLSAYGGSPPMFFGNDGIYTDDFLANGNQAILEGMYGTSPQPDTSDTYYQRFITNYENRFGFNPDSYAEYGYDATYVLAYAIQRAQVVPNSDANTQAIALLIDDVANDSSGTKVYVDQFSTGKSLLQNSQEIDYYGASGDVEFDDTGDRKNGSYVIWKIENQSFVEVETQNITNIPIADP